MAPGNQSSPGVSGTGQESRESTLERRKSESNPDKRGGTPEPGRRRETRTNSMSSMTGRWGWGWGGGDSESGVGVSDFYQCVCKLRVDKPSQQLSCLETHNLHLARLVYTLPAICYKSARNKCNRDTYMHVHVYT